MNDSFEGIQDSVGLGGLQNAIDLSRSTAESWQTVWDSVIDPNNDLWMSLVALGLTLAALSLLYVAVTTGKEIIERQSWSELISLFIWPLVILVFLGHGGRVMAQTTLLIRGIGNDQVTQVLEHQAAGTTLGSAINQSLLTLGGEEAVDRAYRECQQETGNALNQCWTNATNRVQSIVDEAEQEAGHPLPELRQHAARIANAVNLSATQNEQEQNSILGRINSVSELLSAPGRTFDMFLMEGLLTGVQWAFVNMLEASLLLTALFGPIAMGLSLLPLQGRPIVSWLIGFISLFGVQLGYNIIVGLVATVISQAGAITASDLGFMLFLAIFAPLLATLIAGGGGIALYQGVQGAASTLLQVSTSVIKAIREDS